VAGFFRELAVRALAPRGSVHPVSAAPYSPRVESELPDAAVWPGAASPAARSGAARAPEPRGVASASHTTESAPGEDDVHFSSGDPVTAPVRAANPQMHEPRRLAPQSATAAQPGHGAEPEISAPARSTHAAPRAPHPVAPLRPAALPARAPVAPVALRVESRADADTQPAPEVHIHIGRIELTAAPTPVEKPRKPATRKAMSLDEYLQQKSRRRS
jgi:hypothetical protein